MTCRNQVDVAVQCPVSSINLHDLLPYTIVKMRDPEHVLNDPTCPVDIKHTQHQRHKMSQLIPKSNMLCR